MGIKKEILGLIRRAGKFGHTFANSGNPDETALMSRLIRIFTVCLVNTFYFYSNNQNMNQTRSLSEFSRPSEFTLSNI